MDDAFAPGDAAMRALRIRLVRRFRQELGVGDRHITERSRMKPVTVKCPKGAEARIAQRRRLFEHCVEYRREIARRAVDHLQYLGGGGLLLQSLACLGDEPGILHCDDRLRGEVLQQRYLLIREWADLPTIRGDHTEEGILFAKPDGEERPAVFEVGHLSVPRMGSVSWVLTNIRDVNHALATQQPPSGCVGRGTRGAVLPKPLAQTRCPTYRDRIEPFAGACPQS